MESEILYNIIAITKYIKKEFKSIANIKCTDNDLEVEIGKSIITNGSIGIHKLSMFNITHTCNLSNNKKLNIEKIVEKFYNNKNFKILEINQKYYLNNKNIRLIDTTFSIIYNKLEQNESV